MREGALVGSLVDGERKFRYKATSDRHDIKLSMHSQRPNFYIEPLFLFTNNNVRIKIIVSTVRKAWTIDAKMAVFRCSQIT